VEKKGSRKGGKGKEKEVNWKTTGGKEKGTKGKEGGRERKEENGRRESGEFCAVVNFP